MKPRKLIKLLKLKIRAALSRLSRHAVRICLAFWSVFRPVFLPVAVWLIIWQVAAVMFHQPLLLPAPLQVLRRLLELIMNNKFWRAIAFSSVRILSGFLLGCITGIAFAIPASVSRRIRDFLYPAALAMKTIPVASFVILALIWLDNQNLSVFISFLMSFPPVYSGVLNAVLNINQDINFIKLLEMAKIFRVPITRQIRAIYIPHILPAFRTAVSVSMGLCWKAGTAAELIGLPRGSLGEQLYNAKIYFLTADLFAWTVIIIALSASLERVFLWILDKIAEKL